MKEFLGKYTNRNQEPTSEHLITEIEKGGKWKILNQKPDQDFVELEGQKVELPLANMSGLIVVLEKNKDGKWIFAYRVGSKEELSNLLKILKE